MTRGEVVTVRTAQIFEKVAWTAESQYGYVTRAQAVAHAVTDVELHRAVAAGALERAGHGIYRIRGAPGHPLPELWVAWLQLQPDLLPHQRSRHPTVWVSHASAARALDLGVLAADEHEFSTTPLRRTRRGDVRMYRLAAPLVAEQWQRAAGMAVTTPAQTVADLYAQHVDGGHVGDVARDALDRELVEEAELIDALAAHDPHPDQLLAALLSMTDSQFA